MAIRIQVRRDTAIHWANANPVLAQGEIGLETDTGRSKIGDGGTVWNKLDYSVNTITANTIKDLLDSNFIYCDLKNLTVNILGYHELNDGGRGIFYWDANQPKSNHNGGTIIDPTAPFPTDWNDTTQQDTWFNSSNSGNGCWMRLYDDYVMPEWFGAKGDGSDCSIIFSKILVNDNQVILPNDTCYYISSPITLIDWRGSIKGGGTWSIDLWNNGLTHVIKKPATIYTDKAINIFDIKEQDSHPNARALIKGISIDGGGVATAGISIINNSVRVEDCIIEDCVVGIYTSQNYNGGIIHSRIASNGTGIKTGIYTNIFTIYDNKIMANDVGIEILSDATELTIENNDFTSNHYQAILIDGGSFIHIPVNIIRNYFEDNNNTNTTDKYSIWIKTNDCECRYNIIGNALGDVKSDYAINIESGIAVIGGNRYSVKDKKIRVGTSIDSLLLLDNVDIDQLCESHKIVSIRNTKTNGFGYSESFVGGNLLQNQAFTNLIRNGSFENETAYWENHGNNTIATDTTNQVHGNACVLSTPTSTSDYFYQDINYGDDLKGKIICLRFYIKRVSGQTARVVLPTIYSTERGNIINQTINEDGWHTFYGWVPTDDSTMQLRFYADITNGTGQAYFDGISLTVGPFPILNSVITHNGGIATFSGDGSTKNFSIPHKLPGTPAKYSVTPASGDAATYNYCAAANSTNINIYFKTAPPSGTNNLKLAWEADLLDY